MEGKARKKPIGDRFLSKVRKEKDKRLNIRRDRYEENESWMRNNERTVLVEVAHALLGIRLLPPLETNATDGIPCYISPSALSTL
jgi:hypothetical protein